jgi:hypothetical protein
MMTKKMILPTLFMLGIATLCSPVGAAYVTPQMGGGEVGMMQGAAMKHTDVMFDGSDISLHVDDEVDTPMLRPLTPPNEFDPLGPWAVPLTGKAYNFQHAWNPGGFISLPGGTAIWVERLSHSAGLEAYKRSPATPVGEALFTSDGERWKWSGAMTHNIYAVLNPAQSIYSATYRVYLGDALTGEVLDGYGSAEVTWLWTATPVVPEPAMLAAMVPMALGVMMRRRR